MNKLIVFITLIFFAALTGCSTVKIGMIGTRNIDYSATYEKKSATSIEKSVSLFIIIPIKMDDLTPIELIDRAIEKEGYEFLTDVTVEETVIPLFVYTYAGYKIKGTGWKKSGDKASLGSEKTGYIVSKKDGEIVLEKCDENMLKDLK